MPTSCKSYIACSYSIVPRLLIGLCLVSVTLLTCKRDLADNDLEKFEQCIGYDLNDLLLELERRLEVFLAEHYGHRGDDILDYRRFVDDWNTEKAEEMFYLVQRSIDEEIGRSLINSFTVRKIVNWSLEMGDSTWLYTRKEGEQLVNQIRFNHQGKYKNCLEASGDSLATAYLAVKDLDDPPYRAMASFLLFYLEQVNTDFELLQQLILIELYLRPLAVRYLEQTAN